MTQVVETEVMTGNVKDIVNRLSRDMTNRTPFSVHSQNERKQSIQYVASFPYSSQQPDELSFSVGDIIELIEEVEDGWSKGRLKSTGEIGMYPTNFVTLKSNSVISNSRPKISANEVNMRNEPKAIERTPSTVICEQISLPKNDSKLSTFPISSIASLPSSTATTEYNSEIISQKTKEMARVKFVYNPQHPDELALAELDILINIISKNCGDAGWFEGELRGRKGVFPDNFVELVQVPNETESGIKFSNLSTSRQSSLDRLINKPLPANPPQPAVPPKPVNMKTDPIVPSGSATSVAANKNSFAAIREKMSTHLKVVAPENIGAIQSKTNEQSNRSSDGQIIENAGAEPTFDVNSSGDQVPELQHITKNRARAPKNRPMSMVMNKNLSSNESQAVRLSSPISSNPMSTSMFALPVVKETPTTILPFKTSVIPSNVVPPSSAMKPALRPLIGNSPIESKSDPLKKAHSPDGLKPTDAGSSNNSTTKTPAASDYVSRAEYEALLDKVRMIEARLMAIEELRF